LQLQKPNGCDARRTDEWKMLLKAGGSELEYCFDDANQEREHIRRVLRVRKSRSIDTVLQTQQHPVPKQPRRVIWSVLRPMR